MISLATVNDEIKELLNSDREGIKKSVLNRMRRRVEFLEVVKKYLEFDPSESFVKSEKGRIDKIINKIKDGFGGWLVSNKEKGETYKEQRDAYEKEMELKKYKTQFKALDFILQ